MMKSIEGLVRVLAVMVALFAGFLFVGCDNKETIMDVDTPSGGVEIERDRTTGEMTVDVDQ
jgi:hypothetical protein